MIRDVIKAEVLKQGLSVYELAKRSRLQRTQLGLYLKGEKDLHGENIDEIFKALMVGLCLYNTEFPSINK